MKTPPTLEKALDTLLVMFFRDPRFSIDQLMEIVGIIKNLTEKVNQFTRVN